MHKEETLQAGLTAPIARAPGVTAIVPSDFNTLVQGASTTESAAWTRWDSAEYVKSPDGKLAEEAYNKEKKWQVTRSKELFNEKYTLSAKQSRVLPVPFLYVYNFADKEQALVSAYLRAFCILHLYALGPPNR